MAHRASASTLLRASPACRHLLQPSRRAFSLPSFNIPASSRQEIQARRTLPYPATQVYSLIADVDSYSTFLPFCTHSRVTRWGPPDASGRRWPTLADMTVGWGPVTESYTSRLYCVPGQVVEAVSGNADTTIPAATLRELGLDGAHAVAAATSEGVFDSLVTRWTLHPGPGGGVGDTNATEVTLGIRFRFRNPAYGLAIGQVADDMVGVMIEAFEKRAREVYGSPQIR